MHSDIRLSPVYSLIDSGAIDVISLDIFDTLLWRKLPAPKDLFLLLGKYLNKEGWLKPSVTPTNFAQLREFAENTARVEKSIAQDTLQITLTEIYWQLCQIFVQLSTEQMLSGAAKGVYESDVIKLVNIELDFESKFIRCDQNILNLINFANAKKIPVVLVSDTYFEESAIRNFLRPFLDLSTIAGLYLSSEWGCGKHEGLLGHVVRDLKIDAKKIVHIGDNYEADYEAAVTAGMKAVYFSKCDAKFDEVLEREWPTDFLKREKHLDDVEGDFGLTGLRTKLTHHEDLSLIKNHERFFWKYGATVLGPVLAGFIHWIYERCYQKGQHQVFCLLREGKLYANLIHRFAPFYPKHRLEAKQLWVSRLFITHASMASANQNELIATMNALLEHFTIEDFCTYLGLDVNTMPQWKNYRHVLLEAPSLRKNFIIFLLTRDELRQKIVQKASAKRERYLTYLAKLTDLSAANEISLVDVGWHGTAQMSLQSILELAGSNLKLHGLYLGTTQKAGKLLLKGVVSEGYLFKNGYPDCGNAHEKACFVLEQTATAETGLGALQDIDSAGSIITHPFLIPAKQKKQVETIQQGIFAFFDLLGHHMQTGQINWDSHSEALQNQLRSALLRSMINVTAQEARKFGPWFHEHGPTTHLTQVIGKNHYYDKFIKDMLPVAAHKQSGLNWPAAYTAKHSKYLTLTSEAMWLNTLPSRCFLSEDAFTLQLFLDTGKSFPKKANQSLILRSNPNRNFFTHTQAFSSKKPFSRVQLSFSLEKALIRIKSLRVIAYDKTTPLPEHLAFYETEKDSPTIECVLGQQLDFNTFLSEASLKLQHTFAKNHVYQIKVKLCCEIFKLTNKI